MQKVEKDDAKNKKQSYRLKDNVALNEEESVELLAEMIANTIIDQILAYEKGESPNEGIVAAES